ncbi:hypothetical protein AB6A40_009033 [Gnathostoma spinigerum]|uniref:Zinc finger double-stranded RNA binding domain-containing protein n=1 Tax=Gnathostoma spinigerum TaxID=75299 RepID=A0ABD6EYJ4_9BILA
MPKKHSQSNKTRKRKGKDLDQITEDLKPEKMKKLLETEQDLDLPGKGQFRCIHCDRFFIDDETMQKHKRTKGWRS